MKKKRLLTIKNKLGESLMSSLARKCKRRRLHSSHSLDNKKFMKSFTLYAIIFIIISYVLLGGAHGAWAVVLSFVPQQLAVSKEQEFLVDFFLDTKNVENINAMEGTLYYPSGLLELKEIRDGNSIINFWVERPKEYTTGQIRFSGITPGGYQGQKGFIFGMVFQAKTIGKGIIEMREQNILRNDGKGTAVPAQTNSFEFTVSQTNVSAPLIINQEDDRDPPEEFALEIARDQNLFENKWFVVFASQDKGSGIDYYKIREKKQSTAKNPEWIRAESPYVLQDQGLMSFIFVRAVDRMGNERVAELGPQSSPQYARYLVWSILGAMVAGYVLVKILWRKWRRKK